MAREPGSRVLWVRHEEGYAGKVLWSPHDVTWPYSWSLDSMPGRMSVNKDMGVAATLRQAMEELCSRVVEIQKEQLTRSHREQEAESTVLEFLRELRTVELTSEEPVDG